MPKVLASIERFGYQAPIIVDAEHVIIVGHTRYAALRQLGWSEIPVLVSDMEPQAAQEYRIVDNKTSEYATWNPDLLLVEVRQAHEDVAEAFFPDIDLSIEFAAMAEADLGEERVEKAQVQMETKYQDGAEERIQVRKVTCPGCYQTFEIEG
ncbi:ParB-like nuclease domain protein [compost metagenome]